MSATPETGYDLWHQVPPSAYLDRQSRTRAAKSRRRVLAPVEPLASPSEPATFADAIAEEIWRARVGKGRTACHLSQALKRHAPPDEITLLQDAVERAEIRYQNVRARLIRRLAEVGGLTG